MPSIGQPTIVITHAVVGPRNRAHAWFAANGLVPDAYLVAERKHEVEGVTYINRYVAHENLTAADAGVYDHVIDLTANTPI